MAAASVQCRVVDVVYRRSSSIDESRDCTLTLSRQCTVGGTGCCTRYWQFLRLRFGILLCLLFSSPLSHCHSPSAPGSQSVQRLCLALGSSALTRFPLTRRRRSAYVHSATRHKSRAALCAVHAHPSALAPPAPARCPSPAPAIATRDATSSLLTNTLPPQSPRRLARHVRRPTQPSHLMDGVAAPQRLTACQRLLG